MRKCKFLNELKKYSKTVGLVLALGGASGVGVAQCPALGIYHPPKFKEYTTSAGQPGSYDFEVWWDFANDNPGSGKGQITVNLTLECYGLYECFIKPYMIIVHCKKKDNSFYDTLQILNPIRDQEYGRTFKNLSYGEYYVNVSAVTPTTCSEAGYIAELPGVRQEVYLTPKKTVITVNHSNKKYDVGQQLLVNVTNLAAGIKKEDIEVKIRRMIPGSKPPPKPWDGSDEADDYSGSLDTNNCKGFDFCNGYFETNDRWVKLAAHIKNSTVWSDPVYVAVGNPNNYHTTPDKINDKTPPSIETDRNNCYRAGNTVKVYVSNIDANDNIRNDFNRESISKLVAKYCRYVGNKCL